MPPLSSRRSLSSSLPTLLSLSKLLQAVPQAISRHNVKRSSAVVSRGAMLHLAMAAGSPIEPEDPPDSPIFWWKLGLSAGLVLLGGVFAGLTLALMGSDDLNLRVLASSSDDPKERKAATKVLRLLSRGRHWVLVVLLLGNVIVNESLPIFLDDILGGGVAAVVVSTTMIVIFGEIIPQAVCVRYGLSIGGVCAPFVFCLMILFAPVAWPTAKLLDYVLGAEEGHTYKKAELKSFLQFHREGDEPLRDDEIGILNGVLSLNDKHAKEIMTPISDCLILPSNKILDHAAIDQILLSGFSRIPIHEPGQKSNFVGMLLVKRLITYSPEDEWPVSKFPLLPLPEARPDINCFQALDYFQTGRAHLLLITESPGKGEGAMGIVSLEDLIEEIIGEEIVDETDRFEDNRSRKAAKRSGTANVMRGIIERQRVLNAFANSRAPSRQDTFSTPPIQLNQPTGTQDGLLIQVDEDSNLVAESVSVPTENTEDPLATEGQKLGMGAGAMDSILENSEQGSPVLDKQNGGANGSSNTADENGEGGKGERHEGDKQGTSGDPVAVLKSDDSLAFAAFADFEEACLALVAKYARASARRPGSWWDTGAVGPERTNAGWEWREHKWAKGHGYLARRTTRRLRRPSQRVVSESHADADTRQSRSGCSGSESGDEHSGLESENDEERRPLVGHAKEIRTRRAEANASMNADGDADMDVDVNADVDVDVDVAAVSERAAQRGSGGGPTSRRIRGQEEEGEGAEEVIEVEHSIVFSRTYHVPMLCLRAWDSTGSTLSLESLLSAGILRPLPRRPDVHDIPHDNDNDDREDDNDHDNEDGEDDHDDNNEDGEEDHDGNDNNDSDMVDQDTRVHIRPDAIMLDPHSPFPLLQQTEQPEIGGIVWSVHPCHVRDAVDEVLLAQSLQGAEVDNGENQGRDGERGHADGSGSDGAGVGSGGRREGRGLEWLETWLMISGSVVDLTWP